MTHDQPLRRVWGQDKSTGSGPARAIVRRLRRKLGDDANTLTHSSPKGASGTGWRKERRRTAWGVEHRSCRRARAARFPRLTPRTARVTRGENCRRAVGESCFPRAPSDDVQTTARRLYDLLVELAARSVGVKTRALSRASGPKSLSAPLDRPPAPSGGSVGFYGRYRAARNATLAAFTTIPAKCRVVAPSCIAAVCHGRPGHRPVRSFRGGGVLRRGQGVGRCVHLAALDGRGLSRGVVRFVDSIIHDGDIIDLSALVLL